jgi:peptide/nickel transport system ATP-binding protein
MSDSLLEINNLSVSYKNQLEKFDVVKNVSLSIYEGEILGLIGESGSGKTQLSLSCLGLNHGRSEIEGSIKVCGSEIIGSSKETMQKKLGSEIAMIFQNPMTSFNPFFKIKDQLPDILASKRNISYASAIEELISAFQEVSLTSPEIALEKYPHEFSGGQLQRIMIALAVACETKIIIADEPTTALDVTNQAQIIKLLKSIVKKYSIGLLFISHDLSSMFELADKIFVMRNGEIIEKACADKFKHAQKHSYSKLLIDSLPRISKIDKVTEIKEEIDSPVLLEAKNISKIYKSNGKEVSILKSINFDLHKGESLALVGGSGSGKTTLAMILIQLIRQTHGEVIFKDVTLKKEKNSHLQSFRKNIGVVFQNPYSSLNPRMKIFDIIAEPLKEMTNLTKEEIESKVSSIIHSVGLDYEHLSRYPSEFSGGQRQRIAIARAFINEPELIILDEPTASLDLTTQTKIIKLLNDLRTKTGTTFLFISHDLALVDTLAKRILVIYNGQIIESGLTKNVLNSPSHTYTKVLIDSIPSFSKII